MALTSAPPPAPPRLKGASGGGVGVLVGASSPCAAHPRTRPLKSLDKCLLSTACSPVLHRAQPPVLEARGPQTSQPQQGQQGREAATAAAVRPMGSGHSCCLFCMVWGTGHCHHPPPTSTIEGSRAGPRAGAPQWSAEPLFPRASPGTCPGRVRLRVRRRRTGSLTPTGASGPCPRAAAPPAPPQGAGSCRRPRRAAVPPGAAGSLQSGCGQRAGQTPTSPTPGAQQTWGPHALPSQLPDVQAQLGRTQDQDAGGHGEEDDGQRVMRLSGRQPQATHGIVCLVPGKHGGVPKLGTAGTHRRALGQPSPTRAGLPRGCCPPSGRWVARKDRRGPSLRNWPPEGPTSTHSDQGLQRPSWPPEKVPVAQSTHSKPKSKFPGDRQTAGVCWGR